MQNNLLLIDAYGFIFRAYHVLPNMISHTGDPVGAIYGFTSMLFKIIADLKPKHMCIVFDSGGKNFRHEIFPNYKAHRPPVHQDLIAQLPHMRHIANALNIKYIEQYGVEADDIIATLTKKALHNNDSVIVISSDKDLMQLISAQVQMFDPIKHQFVTEQNIMDKFGVNATKVREVLALMGDKSDNIKGVDGVGIKTAAQLINQFHTVKNLLNSTEQIQSIKLRDKIIQHQDDALLSWELVGLKEDLENIDYLLDSFKWTIPFTSVVLEFLNNYDFKSLNKRAMQIFINDNLMHLDHTNPEEALITIDNDIEILEQILAHAKELGSISIALITKQHIPYSIELAYNHIRYQIILESNILEPDNFWFYKHLLECFQNKSIKKITKNLKALMHFFSNIKRELVHFTAFDDLDLMQYSISTRHTLTNDETTISVQHFAQIHQELMQKMVIEKVISLYQEIDMPIAHILYKIEHIGIKVDPEVLKNLASECTEKINELSKEIWAIAGIEFNIASTKQLSHILFDKLQIPTVDKKSNHSTNSEVLEILENEGHVIAKLLLQWRQFTKIKSTYTESLLTYINPITQRIHTTFLQNKTSTARLSSENPNLQNIPVRSLLGNAVRKAFIPAEGYVLVSADYSQIELRILSIIASVQSLKDSFTLKQDIHSKTACDIFKLELSEITKEHRRKAKAINFGIIYGISPFGLSKQLGISTTLATKYIQNYFDKYPEIKTYMDEIKVFAKQNHYVSNMFGRKCHINGINDANKNIRTFAERAAINAPIQSTSADIIKIAMINIENEITKAQLDVRMILQIHDELLFEVKYEVLNQSIQLIKKSMECLQNFSTKIPIPLVVNIQTLKNWAECI